MLAIVVHTLAMPIQSDDLQLECDTRLIKRMMNQDDDPHDHDCLCFHCYCKRLNLPPIKMKRANDTVTDPVLQTICYPCLRLVDLALCEFEDSLNYKQKEMIVAKYMKWLETKNWRPHGDTASSSTTSIDETMVAPEPMRPMREEQADIGIRRDHQLRRRPENRRL